jgi:hypothetical protein
MLRVPDCRAVPHEGNVPASAQGGPEGERHASAECCDFPVFHPHIHFCHFGNAQIPQRLCCRFYGVSAGVAPMAPNR